MTDRQTVITGITKMFSRDGTLAATLASPRVTLDARGDVVTEERLSIAGLVEARKQFSAGRLLTEERFAADGKLDERIVYSYDASGHLAKEAMAFDGGAPHGTWVHHRDAQGRLVGRDFVKPDGKVEATETYTYAADGKTATMVRAHVGQWKYRYDDSGRVLHEEGGPASGDDMDQIAIDYAYDARHRLISEVARAGGRVQRELAITY
jgi:YD repeat-containing protein